MAAFHDEKPPKRVGQNREGVSPPLLCIMLLASGREYAGMV